MSTAQQPVLPVVAAVVHHQDGRILIAKRPAHKHQGGLWEFPGGKIAAGETQEQALARELYEEIGIEGGEYEPLITLVHSYPELTVRLSVWQVRHFIGEAYGKEGQACQWVWPAALDDYTFPDANTAIVQALRMPHSQAITGHAHSREHWFSLLHQALALGAGSIQLRSASLPASQLLTYVPQAADACAKAGVPLFLNSRLGPLPQLMALGCDGIHLQRKAWQGLTQRPVPAKLRLSLACHNAQELAAACQLGADFALLSPVLPTPSHPEALGLGWQGLAQLCQGTNLPIMALGGLTPAHRLKVLQAGASSFAALSAYWPNP